MHTILSLNLTNQTRANAVLQVGRGAVKNAVQAAYQEIKNSRALGGGINAYNEVMCEGELEAEADAVRQTQGHEHKPNTGHWSALADAACDELQDLIEELKKEAPRDKSGEIPFKSLESIMYFDYTLERMIAEAFEFNWGKEQDPSKLSGKAVERKLAEMRKAYGNRVTFEDAKKEVMETRTKVSEVYRNNMDEITRLITEYATAHRKIDCASFESLYTAHRNRRDAAYDVLFARNNVRQSIDRFQAVAFERKFNTVWAGTIVAQKEGELAQLDKLVLEFADCLPDGSVDGTVLAAKIAADAVAAAGNKIPAAGVPA